MLLTDPLNTCMFLTIFIKRKVPQTEEIQGRNPLVEIEDYPTTSCSIGRI